MCAQFTIEIFFAPARGGPTPIPVATLMVRMICVGFQRRSVRRPYRGHMLLLNMLLSDKVILLTLLRLIMDKFVAVGSLYWI